MANEEIIKYIKEALAVNSDRVDIEKKLLEAGWDAWDIEAAFSFIKTEEGENVYDEDIVGEYPKPVIKKIKTVEDYICDLLSKGKTRKEIYDELTPKGFSSEEIENVFCEQDRYDGETELSPALALGFIIVALSFFSFLVATWQNLSELARASSILFFCFFYFFFGVYLKFVKGLIIAGEVCYLFSAVVLGLGVFLLSNYYLPNLSWFDISILWMFLGMLIGIATKTKIVLKFALIIGLIPAIAYPFTIVRSGKSFFSEGLDVSTLIMLVVFICLLLSSILIEKKIK